MCHLSWHPKILVSGRTAQYPAEKARHPNKTVILFLIHRLGTEGTWEVGKVGGRCIQLCFLSIGRLPHYLKNLLGPLQQIGKKWKGHLQYNELAWKYWRKKKKKLRPKAVHQFVRTEWTDYTVEQSRHSECRQGASKRLQHCNGFSALFKWN